MYQMAFLTIFSGTHIITNSPIRCICDVILSTAPIILIFARIRKYVSGDATIMCFIPVAKWKYTLVVWHRNGVWNPILRDLG